MNILKKLRKPQFAFFLSFLILFISCNKTSSEINESETSILRADVIFNMENTTTIYNKGEDYFTHINFNGEESHFTFEDINKIAIIKQERNPENNLLIEFDDSASTVSLNNITQLSNNSVSMDIVFNDNNSSFESSVVLDTNITVEQFVSTLIGTHDLGNTSAVISGRCPWCVVVVVIAVIAACENAQNACTPCNGNLLVGPCSCSCEVPQD